MADDTVDKLSLLEHAIETFNRRDVEEWVNLFHPDVRMVPSPYWAPPGTVYHGRPGMRSYAHEVFARIPRARAVPPQTLREVGDLAVGKVMMASDGDQTPDDARPIHVLYSFRDGQIFTMEGFMSATDALEAAQWRSGSTFGLLFQNTAEAVLLNHDDGTVVVANAPAAALYGLDVDALRGRSIFEFAPPELAGALRDFWRGFRERGQLSIESNILSRTGERHHVELRAKADFVPGRHLVLIVERPETSEATPPDRFARPRLTPREREVFRLLALGFSGVEVAERLVLSPHTVRRHVEKGVARLEAKNRVQAIAIALTSGEIEL
jgi:PAS domain S-box-containing protein